MKWFILISTCSLLWAQTPEPAPPQSQAVVLKGATIHVGDGTVIENGFVAFDQGKITHVSANQPNVANAKLVDISGKHVYPGFILLNSTLGLTEVSSVRATLDMNEQGSLNPNVRALIAYNTDSELIPTMRFNGILTAQTTPRGGIVSGQSSMVQLDAWNWEDASISADSGLHINWPASMRRQFDFATFSRIWKKNENQAEQLATLTKLFEEAMVNKDSKNLKLKAVQGVFDGSKRVYFHVDRAQDILDALAFAKRLNIKKPVLVGAGEADLVASVLVEQNIPVIVGEVHSLPKRSDSPIDSGYDFAVKLHNAGVKVALSYPSTGSARNIGFFAGTLVAYGMDKEAALATITSTAAAITGIDDQVGQIKAGLAATLFVSEGDALDMRGNIVHSAYIQGRLIDLNGRQQILYDRFHRKYNR